MKRYRYLSKLIDVLNDRFGTDFTDADQLFFDQIIEGGDAMNLAQVRPPPPTRKTSSRCCSPACWKLCSSSAWSRTKTSSRAS
jgi:hypothetical protein